MKSIGIVGAGLIGASWAGLFSAYGHETIVFDPDPDAGRALAPLVKAAWASLATLNPALSSPGALQVFTHDLSDLGGVDFVQENAPDRLDVKQALLADLELEVRPDVVIASSTSALLTSDIQSAARLPGRILVGHPMNPPHLVPMVELVAGRQTDPGAVDTAERLYRTLDRVTVRVRREVVGHLANRLTSALYREAVHIAAEGIADVEDIDRAIAYGPGLRWALMGPHLTYHLGGGKGGYRHYLDHLGPAQEARWRDHGSTPLTDEVKALLVEGVERELEQQDRGTIAARRDAALVDILKIKKTRGF